MRVIKMLNKIMSVMQFNAQVPAPHIAAAVAKMEQAENRLAGAKGITLFQTDYLE
ncbi:hypothetical protein ACPR111641_00595 [Acinetobacter pragensis]